MTDISEKLRSGDPYPLGATCCDEGINFALFSAHAEKVELCLFSPDGSAELQRYPLPSKTNQVWHGFLPKAKAGTVYGYRIHGDYQPSKGHRFNPNKLVIDPYARALLGDLIPSDLHYDFERHGLFAGGNAVNESEIELSRDTRDNAMLMPKCVVVADRPSCEPLSPRIEESQMLIYEAHIKGLTQLHPAIPQSERGKLAGLSSDHCLGYLKSLGVTSLELLPVHSFVNEPFLEARNLSNYWGYNTLAFFAPHQRYLSNNDIFEFRRMVERVHDFGMEVILDVVFNHTAEGGKLGPTLSFRGIDNLSYYRLQPDDLSRYVNDTGCGNTVNCNHPRVIQMLLDSLRYWVSCMGVDGFRFDLATVLGRDEAGFDISSSFFLSLQQDPVLARTKFIAEPWDIGPGGYQLGNFPLRWSEWNDKYRDAVRRFWRGDSGLLPEFARRIHGSSDIIEPSGRPPSATINFVASHDGFTLADTVSFRDRHNLANKEENRDGHQGNFSENYGVEGNTTDKALLELRWQQQRNILATLLFSQGTPMLLAGDEFGRSQKGNNNAYCQDNNISWLDWGSIGPQQEQHIEFVKQLVSLRQRFPIFSTDRYVHEPASADGSSMEWFNSDGKLMQSGQWEMPAARTLGQMLSWFEEDTGSRQRVFLIYHADDQDTDFSIPQFDDTERWELVFDTGRDSGMARGQFGDIEQDIHLIARSMVLLLSYDTKR